MVAAPATPVYHHHVYPPSWEVEGAALRQEGEAVVVVDERGRARMRVTAPRAYAEGGRPIEGSARLPP